MPFLDGKPVIITKRNTDKHGNPISVKQIETKQVVDIHNSIPLNYSIDRNHPIVINGMHQIYNKDEISENTFYADYDQGILYFHPTHVGKSITVTYMGTGYILISSDRIYRYNKGDGISATESIEASFEKLENILNTIIKNGGGCDQIVAEVIGSRTDAQGQTFPSLGDRLNYIANNVQDAFIQIDMLLKDKVDKKDFNDLTNNFNLLNQEVIDARTDKNGVVNNNLKERLDKVDSHLEHITIKTDIHVNVKEFGAKGDGSICNEAIENAIKYAETKIQSLPNTGWKTACLTIIFPEGKYTVTKKGVLSPNISFLSGFNIKGSGYRNTIIEYNYDGDEEDSYLLQVGSKSGETYKKAPIGYSSIDDISIYGNGKSKFFGLYSQTGSPTSFRFNNVFFENLKEFVSIRYGSADANSDMFKFFQCKCMTMPIGSTIFAIFDDLNGQSVAHDFVACDFNTNGKIFYIKSGGCINVFGGSWCGTGTDTLLHIENTNGKIGNGNNMFTFYGVRPEIRNLDQNAIVDNSLFYVKGNIKLQFNDITFGQLTSNTKDVIYGTIKDNGVVTFTNCTITGNFKSKLISNTTSYSYSYKPTLIYDSCRMYEEVGKLVSLNIPNDVTVANTPKVIARNCTKYRSGSQTDLMPVDVCLGSEYGYYDTSGNVKIFNFSNTATANNNGIKIPLADGSPVEVTFKMPIGAKIQGFNVNFLKTSVFSSIAKTINFRMLVGDEKEEISNLTLDTSEGSLNNYVVASSNKILKIIEDGKQKITIEASGEGISSGAIPGFYSVEYV